MPVMNQKTGLILSGGGARAAYQVGVLQAIADILPPETRQPFPIITGTSAGAINALALAGRPGNFRSRTRALTTMWGSLESGSIYQTSLSGVTRNALQIFWATLNGRYAKGKSLALLDNSPLRELLEDIIQFTHIERAIASGELDAVAVTAMNYSSGRSTTFYQSHHTIRPWTRSRRDSIATELGVEHLLASSALPTLFPATPIGDEFFGDGALRQIRPLSPAIHLGAERLLIIGVRESTQPNGLGSSVESMTPPTIPQVLGQMLNAVFLDAMEADLETLQRLNKLLSGLSNKQQTALGMEKLRPIETLTISPSRPLADIAQEHYHELPRSMRMFLKATRSIKDSGSGGALSYILFEQGYCQRLIELGYADAMEQSEAIQAFFALSTVFHGEKKASLWNFAGPVVRRPAGTMKKAWLDLLGKKQRRV